MHLYENKSVFLYSQRKNVVWDYRNNMDTPRLAKMQFLLWHLLEMHYVDPLFIFVQADLDPQVMYK